MTRNLLPETLSLDTVSLDGGPAELRADLHLFFYTPQQSTFSLEGPVLFEVQAL